MESTTRRRTGSSLERATEPPRPVRPHRFPFSGNPLARHRLAAVVAFGLAARSAAPISASSACPRCGWVPPPEVEARTVREVTELVEALARSKPGATVLLEDGEYRLSRTLDIRVAGLVLRGRSGDPARVRLVGGGLDDRAVGVGISVSAPRVALADLTVGSVGFHGVQVRGENGAHDVVLHRVRIVDTGQQLLKVSAGADGGHADRGLVACSELGYSHAAPSDYTNGVDVLGGKGWTVRDNRFLRIRGPATAGARAGPAVLFWKNAQDTVVERNVILDSYRGIAFGLGPPQGGYAREREAVYDHQGGAIRNNVVCNLHSWADEGIEVNAARGARIEHNTVFHQGALPWSISVRFPSSWASVRNNLISGRVERRDGGRAEQTGNVTGARADWFADAPGCDLRPAAAGRAAVDAGVPLPDLATDFDGRPRTRGRAPDAGAFESGGLPP